MRIETLEKHHEIRDKVISHKLFELHKEEAILNGCQQLFLEVIDRNDRAIQFYKKLGYEKQYDLSYYKLKDVSQLKINIDEVIEISKIQYNNYGKERKK